jgi:glycosyltransferase involved in cell wall biosynthesis
LWLRCETQDEATLHRSKAKSLIRYVTYYLIYKGFSRIFYIGELNKKHYLKHGVPQSKLVAARYGTIDRFLGWDDNKKHQEFLAARKRALIGADDFVVGFSGKFIPKKNPAILFEMLEYLPVELRSRLCLYFMGSGELEGILVSAAEKALQQFGVRTYFSGFVNQSQIASHYLAMDVLVLPSRRMGETWGLVANEAMQAGCGVIVSDAVGCSADFGGLERFRIFKDGDPVSLAKDVIALTQFERDFNWAAQNLKQYSVEATAGALLSNL